MPVRSAALLWLLSALTLPSVTAAEPTDDADLSDEAILGAPAPYAIRSVRLSALLVDQHGRGFQSTAGPPQGPGSEQALVVEPELEVVATQGADITHRLRVPIDVVSSASPDAIDVTTSASRVTESGSIEWSSTLRVDPHTDVTFRPGIHVEEQMRSWLIGGAVTRSFAEDNTTLTLDVQEVLDWLDLYKLNGHRRGRGTRSSLAASAGISQLLSPTTVAAVNYGLTDQVGELGNAWNSIPLQTGDRGREALPRTRLRHAIVGRLVQGLPWQGSLGAAYRAYFDDWGVAAHSIEGRLSQRVAPWLVLRANYRLHTQRAVRFYTESAQPSDALRTGDSDLAKFVAQTVGGRVALDWPARRGWPATHADLSYERYFRSNHLRANIVACSFGLSF